MVGADSVNDDLPEFWANKYTFDCKSTHLRKIILKVTETSLKSWYLLSWQRVLWVTAFIQKTDTKHLRRQHSPATQPNLTLSFVHFLQSGLDYNIIYMKECKYRLPSWTTVWSRLLRPLALHRKKAGIDQRIATGEEQCADIHFKC